MKPSLLAPAHPERICWGCEKRCPAAHLACGNGSERTLHPVELFGADWYEWSGGTDGEDGGSEQSGDRSRDGAGSGSPADRPVDPDASGSRVSFADAEWSSDPWTIPSHR